MATVINDPYGKGKSPYGTQWGEQFNAGLKDILSNKLEGHKLLHKQRLENQKQQQQVAGLHNLSQNNLLTQLLATNPKAQEAFFKDPYAFLDILNQHKEAQEEAQQQNPQTTSPNTGNQGGFQLFSGSLNQAGQPTGQRVIPISQGGTGLPSGPMGGSPQSKAANTAAQLSPSNPGSGQQLTNSANAQQQINKSDDPMAKLLGKTTRFMKPAERARVAIQAQKSLNQQEYQQAKLEAKKIDQDLSRQKFQQQQEVLERPYYEEMQKDHEASRTTLNDLGRLTNLINKGDVVNPTEDHMYRWAARTLKVNLKDLRGADTEEFEKIVAGFIKNAKNWFGSRVTNYDLESFLKTLPGLTNTHEGKMRLIGSMKAAALAQQIRYDAFRDLMRLNNDHLPPYAKMKVDEMTNDAIEALSKQFISGDLTPKLSPEAIAGMKRNQWMRWVKAFLTNFESGVESAESTAGTIGKVAGHMAPVAAALI
jgi:hypothetical protein